MKMKDFKTILHIKQPNKRNIFLKLYENRAADMETTNTICVIAIWLQKWLISLLHVLENRVCTSHNK